jgi:hypothetical protein
MKRLTFSVIITSLLVLSVTGIAQEKKMDQKKQAPMMEMMKDSTMMNRMMENIAKDDHMRMQMMQKMIQSAKGDQAKMTGLCKAMVEDEDMHSLMMKIMGSEAQTAEREFQEVIVKFKSDTEEEKIRVMASEIGMLQVKEIKALNIRVFKITSQKSLEEVIKHLESESFVEYAEPNKTYKTQK